jgi:hypothetical protein
MDTPSEKYGPIVVVGRFRFEMRICAIVGSPFDHRNDGAPCQLHNGRKARHPGAISSIPALIDRLIDRNCVALVEPDGVRTRIELHCLTPYQQLVAVAGRDHQIVVSRSHARQSSATVGIGPDG